MHHCYVETLQARECVKDFLGYNTGIMVQFSLHGYDLFYFSFTNTVKLGYIEGQGQAYLLRYIRI